MNKFVWIQKVLVASDLYVLKSRLNDSSLLISSPAQALWNEIHSPQKFLQKVSIEQTLVL